MPDGKKHHNFLYLITSQIISSANPALEVKSYIAGPLSAYQQINAVKVKYLRSRGIKSVQFNSASQCCASLLCSIFLSETLQMIIKL